MRFASFFGAAAFVAVAIALPKSDLNIRTHESELGNLAARAPAGDLIVHGSDGAAFTAGGSLSFFSSGGLLSWNGLAQFGYRGVDRWSNNFLGACHDFGIFVKAFSRLVTSFEDSKLPWDHCESAVSKFGSDFAIFAGLLLSFGGFGKLEIGADIFKNYLGSFMKTFEFFFGLIVKRFGVATFSKSLIFGQFHFGFRYIFKFCLKIGLKFHDILESIDIDFSLFQKVSFDLEDLIA